MLKLLVLIFSFYTFQTHGYSINVGTYVPYFSEAQDDNSGSETKLALNPTFSIAGIFTTPWNFYFNPEFGYVHHRNTSDDVDKRTLLFLYTITFPVSSQFIFRTGLGTSWITTKSDGGTIYLNNGDSVSPFAKPSGATTTYVSHITLGGEIFVKSDQAIRFDLQVMAPLDSDQRQYNYLFTFNFYR